MDFLDKVEHGLTILKSIVIILIIVGVIYSGITDSPLTPSSSEQTILFNNTINYDLILNDAACEYRTADGSIIKFEDTDINPIGAKISGSCLEVDYSL